MLIAINKNEVGKFEYKEECSWEEEAAGELKTVFKDGTHARSDTTGKKDGVEIQSIN